MRCFDCCSSDTYTDVSLLQNESTAQDDAALMEAASRQDYDAVIEHLNAGAMPAAGSARVNTRLMPLVRTLRDSGRLRRYHLLMLMCVLHESTMAVLIANRQRLMPDDDVTVDLLAALVLLDAVSLAHVYLPLFNHDLTRLGEIIYATVTHRALKWSAVKKSLPVLVAVNPVSEGVVLYNLHKSKQRNAIAALKNGDMIIDRFDAMQHAVILCLTENNIDLFEALCRDLVISAIRNRRSIAAVMQACVANLSAGCHCMLIRLLRDKEQYYLLVGDALLPDYMAQIVLPGLNGKHLFNNEHAWRANNKYWLGRAIEIRCAASTSTFIRMRVRMCGPWLDWLRLLTRCLDAKEYEFLVDVANLLWGTFGGQALAARIHRHATRNTTIEEYGTVLDRTKAITDEHMEIVLELVAQLGKCSVPHLQSLMAHVKQRKINRVPLALQIFASTKRKDRWDTFHDLVKDVGHDLEIEFFGKVYRWTATSSNGTFAEYIRTHYVIPDDALDAFKNDLMAMVRTFPVDGRQDRWEYLIQQLQKCTLSDAESVTIASIAERNAALREARTSNPLLARSNYARIQKFLVPNSEAPPHRFEVCPVCLSNIAQGTSFYPVTVSCPYRHVFCLACISAWLERREACPVCNCELLANA